MPETNRYVRVDGIVSRGDFKERDGHIWWWQPSRQDWIGLGDVIELTEVRRDVAGQDDDGTLNGEDYIETRLVSDWVSINV